MDILKNNLANNGIEENQHFLESKKITSFQAVKEFFKNVFLDFITHVDSEKASFTEKKHEIYFYIGESSMSVIEQEDKITIWGLEAKASKIIAIVDFEGGYSFVKFINPLKITYLCEEEIEEIFKQVFQYPAVIH